MSDQYVKLEEERRQKDRADKKKKNKEKRKDKRSGRGKRHDSGPESEEDITPAHMVDIVTEEMPEVHRAGAEQTAQHVYTEPLDREIGKCVKQFSFSYHYLFFSKSWRTHQFS